MKGKRQVSVSLRVLGEILQGRMRHNATSDMPADAQIVGVLRTDRDALNGTFTVLAESSEWPELPEGCTPPELTVTFRDLGDRA